MKSEAINNGTKWKKLLTVQKENVWFVINTFFTVPVVKPEANKVVAPVVNSTVVNNSAPVKPVSNATPVANKPENK